jgi:hypothetical protein
MVLPILLPLLIVVHTSVQPRVGQPQKKTIKMWLCAVEV